MTSADAWKFFREQVWLPEHFRHNVHGDGHRPRAIPFKSVSYIEAEDKLNVFIIGREHPLQIEREDANRFLREYARWCQGDDID
jgi:hypothetical protein